MKRISATISAAVIAMIVGSPLQAQAPIVPSFEVASVKPNKSGPQQPSILNIQPGDRVTITNAPLRSLIQAAYRLNGLQLVGGPSPTSPERFDIVAKAATPVSADELLIPTDHRSLPPYKNSSA
jgi:hypothetical protein